MFSLLSTKPAESFSALSSQRHHSNSINTPAVSCFLLSAIAARVSLTANNPTTVPLGPGIRWPTSHSGQSGGDYNVTQCNGRAYVGLSVFPVYRRQRRVCCCGPGGQAISTVPSFGRRTWLQWVCCCGPGGQAISIDNRGGRRVPSSNGGLARRSAANAGSAMLTADGRG